MEQSILLTTLNARYIHSAFGLRYLKANLNEFESQCDIKEFTIDARPEDVLEQLLADRPTIIGFGVYIWNVVQTEKLVALLKAVSPETIVVLGGPEVSYEQDGQALVDLADYVISGWGDVSFYQLVKQLIEGEVPEQKCIAGLQPKLDQISMPYDLYTDEDISNRVIYVEASRGCPFKCEFCLSALDKTAWPFDLDEFMQHMQKLYDRGARHFKFVDRTFNLKIKSSLRIMEFFLERLDEDLFLHFEVVPDHLPEALKEMVARFPAGSLQFEVGIQTFNPEVQSRISRRQDNDKAVENLRWLVNDSQAHVHADLIFGLPGEDLSSFAKSFDALVDIAPHEVQVGILKRLKGSPIIRHTQDYEMVFNPNPPYSIASSKLVSFNQTQFVSRFARYWDLLGNSGRFRASLPLLLESRASAFEAFSSISTALFERTGQTHKISLIRLFDLVFDIGVEELGLDSEILKAAIRQDFERSGLKSIPRVLTAENQSRSTNTLGQARHRQRQSRHL